MKNTVLRRGFFSRLTWGLLLVGLLFFTAPSYAGKIKVQVDSADPPEAEQESYDLEVTVGGDGFGPDSEVDFFITKTKDPGGIKVKTVKWQDSKTLKVTIDVAPDAQIEKKFDIQVRSRGRTGKGTELFRVMKKTEWVWNVYVPGVGTGNWNLYADGNSEGNTFEDRENISLIVRRDSGILYTFNLIIYQDRNSSEKIGFQNLVLSSRTDADPSGNAPCNFPSNNVPCKDLNDEDPGCMKFFLEDHPHPYTDLYDDKNDYMAFWLSIEVDRDIMGMNTGEEVYPSGDVHIEVHRTDSVLLDGCGDFHTIVVDRDVVEGSQVITVKKPTEDSWEITVDTADETIGFTEAYWGYRGKGKGRIVTKKPIRAEGPFKFTATWTRY